MDQHNSELLDRNYAVLGLYFQGCGVWDARLKTYYLRFWIRRYILERGTSEFDCEL